MAGSPTIFLLGGGGLLGSELKVELAAVGTVIAPDRNELDLNRIETVRDAVRRLQPAAIVNAAAYTSVDRAEQERDTALHMNAVVPGALAEEAARLNAMFVHYSTDYVFDGQASRPYSEDDVRHPINVYGETKALGEDRIRAASGAHLVLRTAWLYGARGQSFVGTILRLAREAGKIRVVNDQRGSPTWSRRVAEVTASVLASARTGDGFDLKQPGTYHVVSDGDATWFEFAGAILEYDDHTAHRHAGLVPVLTSDLKLAARRPPYSVLSTRAVQKAFGVHLPHWRSDLALAITALAQ